MSGRDGDFEDIELLPTAANTVQENAKDNNGDPVCRVTVRAAESPTVVFGQGISEERFVFYETITDDSKVRRDRDEIQRLSDYLNQEPFSRTLWINICGNSFRVLRLMETHLLNNSTWFTEVSEDTQAFGGPVVFGEDSEFLWFRGNVWLVDHPANLWESVRRVGIKTFMRLPLLEKPGVLIFHFPDQCDVSCEVERLISTRILYNHPLQGNALNCVWVLSMSMFRALAEQIEWTNHAFTFVDGSSKANLAILQTRQDLRGLLENAERLRAMYRYLSGIAEALSFYSVARSVLDCGVNEASPHSSLKTKAYATLEVHKTKDKVAHSRRMCETYLTQTYELVQLGLLHQLTIMNQRVERGQSSSATLTKIGIGAAGIASVVTPLSLLTSYYGMNVQEFVPGTSMTLYDFWSIGFPIMLSTIIPMAIVLVWMYTKNPRKSDLQH